MPAKKTSGEANGAGNGSTTTINPMTEGEMIDANQWVRCIDIKGGRVIVRSVEKPPDLGEIDTALLGS